LCSEENNLSASFCNLSNTSGSAGFYGAIANVRENARISQPFGKNAAKKKNSIAP
jgi:hypothetical protein